MGDRRNIIVEFSDELSVALYTHWTGYRTMKTLAAALYRGRGRWTDDTYLTRIIFSEMIKDNVLEETGYGIEPFKTGIANYCEASPGYDLIVRTKDQTVQGDNEGDATTLSFEEFIRKYQFAK